MRGTAILNRGKDQRPTVPAAGVQADTETPGHARPRTGEPRLCGRKHGSLWTPACACPASPRACAVLSPPTSGAEDSAGLFAPRLVADGSLPVRLRAQISAAYRAPVTPG